jgi:hypothetical protein
MKAHQALLTLLLGLPVAQAGDPMPELRICHAFGCRMQESLRLEPWELMALMGYLATPAPDPPSERLRLSHAVGLLEVLVGGHTPTYRDQPGNPIDARGPGQLDCIDESRNSTTYLRLFENLGWLRWHRVVERAYRAPLLLDQHWSAQIEELASGKRWVIDSWPRGHGEPALVQLSSHWRWKRQAPSAAELAQMDSASSVAPSSTR